MSQEIIRESDSQKNLQDILSEVNSKKYLLVCGSSFTPSNFNGFFDDVTDGVTVPFVKFSDFKPNPLYEDVCKGVALFNNEGCDAVVAVGGGSALDVAKCIKLYAKMDASKNYLEQEYSDSKIPLIAVPTTAGTGSESTRYAVIYYEGKKQSVTHDSIIPNYAVLYHSALKTLPSYQKKCTMLDALCQGIEAWWSVNSTDESKVYSKIAVERIMKYKDAYLNENDDKAAEQIILATNYAGRAINITQTTAAHAMSYKITSMYGLPHGHAVAICLPDLWEHMCKHMDQCIDKRGEVYLNSVFEEIASALNCSTPTEAVRLFKDMLEEMDIRKPESKKKEDDLGILTDSVNVTRLRNNPVELNSPTLKELYERIIL